MQGAIQVLGFTFLPFYGIGILREKRLSSFTTKYRDKWDGKLCGHWYPRGFAYQLLLFSIGPFLTELFEK